MKVPQVAEFQTITVSSVVSLIYKPLKNYVSD
jgi:hypothetical protein